MERYTKRLSNGIASWNYSNDCYGEDETRNKVFKSVHRQNACEKLAAYEDTGLEPEEVLPQEYAGEIMKSMILLKEYQKFGPIDRLRELKQADDEGRCVVLPAKPDQTIYQWRIGDDCPSVSRLDGVQINADGEITYPIWCGHLTPGDFGETVFLTREEAALRREQDEKGGGSE